MTDFVNDSLTGTVGTSLSGRTPDTTGSAWAAYAHSMDLAYSADTRLYMKLDGSGNASFNNGIATDSNLLTKSTTPATADYFIEVIIKSTGTGDNDDWIGNLGGRLLSNATFSCLRWDIQAPGSGIVLSYQESGGGTFPTYSGTDTSGPTSWSYGDVITIAVSYVGRVITAYMQVGSGSMTQMFQLTRNNANFDAIGTVAWGFQSFASSLDTTKQLLSMRAGYGDYDLAPVLPSNGSIAAIESHDTASIMTTLLASIAAVESSDTVAAIGSAFPTQAAVVAIDGADVPSLTGIGNNISLIDVDSPDTMTAQGYGTPFIKASDSGDRAASTAFLAISAGYLALTAPVATIWGYGSLGETGSGDFAMRGVGPKATIIAYGGGVLKKTAPKPKLVASGVVTLIGTLIKAAPKAKITAAGTSAVLGTLSQVWGAKYLITAYGSGVLSTTWHGKATISASGSVGYVGSVRGSFPSATISATALLAAFGVIHAVETGDTTPVAAVMVATGPRATMVATGHVQVTVEYEAYSVALTPTQDGLRTATTHYTNYPFDRILRWENKYYGIASDGVYELDGDDFNGTPIVSTVQTAATDFGSSELKRAVSLYLAGRAGIDMEVSVITADVDEDTYTYRPVNRGGARNYRVLFGKGIRARYYAYKFVNTEGEDFSFDDMTPETAVTRRNV